MKRILDQIKTLDGALSLTLAFVLGVSGFALLHAFGVTGDAIGVVAPLIVTA